MPVTPPGDPVWTTSTVTCAPAPSPDGSRPGFTGTAMTASPEPGQTGPPNWFGDRSMPATSGTAATRPTTVEICSAGTMATSASAATFTVVTSAVVTVCPALI